MTSQTRRTYASADVLPWKTVSKPKEAGLGDDNWILELEEVDGVEVLYEETESGRVVKFNVSAEPIKIELTVTVPRFLLSRKLRIPARKRSGTTFTKRQTMMLHFMV
jgi:hypothetical protein